MGRHDKEMDVESLQKSGHRRGRCLDVFLVGSVIFLFVAVAVVTAGGLMLVMQLHSKQDAPRPYFEYQASQQTGQTPDSTFKAQNFAYLEALSSELRTSTVKLDSIPYGTGTSVGSNFEFDSQQHSLTPKEAGTYFIYIELSLTCTHNCSSGHLSVHVGDKLTCEVELPDRVDSTPVSRKCWTVSQLQKEKLLTQMTVPKELENWKLELGSSGLGMFLVG
ncbi:uncharacterized protein LOC131973841 [Centropristis striata]|uniref:uncharacterized protein LOC131973841 n=1 Tax=Centropristis striata TaxID=184440 RepID=UPI0027DEDB8F|nr:uncharacterized protein LOC131973841 [Centropristis striata]